VPEKNVEHLHKFEVLLVEDSGPDAVLVQGLLRRTHKDSFSVTHVTTLREATGLLDSVQFGIVILDLGLPDSTGLDTLRTVRAHTSNVPVIVLTATDDEALGVAAIGEGAQDYIPKGHLQPYLFARSVRYAMDRHRSAFAAQQSNELISRMIESAVDAIITKDTNGIITTWNPAAERLFGYSPNEVVGKSILLLIPPDRTGEEQLIQARIRRGERVETFETLRLRKGGTPVHVSVTISPIRNDRGEIVGASKIARDITEQKRAEDTLKRQASLLDQAYDAVLVWEKDGKITFWNKGAENIYGFSKQQAVGRNSHELLSTSARTIGPALASLAERGRWEGELEHVRNDGTALTVESRMVEISEGEHRYVLEINRDVSERKHLAEQLRQSQKMEAIGQLAGGVAHDFNNLLGVILGTSEILAESTDLQKTKKGLMEIRKAGQRAANLTRQLLAFGRKQVLEPKILDLNDAVTEMTDMLRRLVGEDIEIDTAFASPLNNVRVDPGQVEQILLNLAVNARDAMPQGGSITIETQNAVLDESYARSHAGVAPGRYVMLAVSDSGSGMDAETQKRVFEPFFTTKKSGTGLGLATVYGAVKQSGGHIWLYSELGKGTTFKIYFPEAVASAEKRGVEEREPSSTNSGTETILLVEDSDSLLAVTREFLLFAGYKVIDACNGKEALRLARGHIGPIHLLLTDVIMPEMSGRTLADEISRIHPETRILYMSGYTANAIVHHGVLDEGINLLSKPFSRAALTKKVSEVLNKTDLPVAAKPHE
jgi:two-component system, cell cycle sensor histidine kinase and response regulator CckA